MLREIIEELIATDIPGFVFSMLIPLLFLIVMIKDKRSKHVLLYFAWGVCSVLFAYVFNEWFSRLSGGIGNVSADIAPIVEETLKALPLLLFFWRKNLSPMIIIYCAMASGIGFSVQEMLYYFTQFTADSGLYSLIPLLVRTATTCLMHGMTTAIIGFGLTITVNLRIIRVPMVLGLLALASVIHSLYNILINTRLAVLALIMPAALYLTGLALSSGEGAEEGADDGV